MAKKSAVEKDQRRRRLVKRDAAKRAALKALAYDRSLSREERFQAFVKLAALPRNGAKTRVRNRLSGDRSAARLLSQVQAVAHCAQGAGVHRAGARNGQIELVGKEHPDGDERSSWGYADPDPQRPARALQQGARARFEAALECAGGSETRRLYPGLPSLRETARHFRVRDRAEVCGRFAGDQRDLAGLRVQVGGFTPRSRSCNDTTVDWGSRSCRPRVVSCPITKRAPPMSAAKCCAACSRESDLGTADQRV